MKHPSLKLIPILALVACSSTHAQTYTDPVGVVKLTIPKATSANEPSFSFLSVQMSKDTVYTGQVSAGAVNTITVSNAGWESNQFAGSNGTHYLHFTSGSREGQMIDIASNTSDTITLSADNVDFSGETGSSFRVLKHLTIASIFGADPTAQGMIGSGTAATADQVLLFNPATESYTTYYYKTIDNPFDPNDIVGWVSASDNTQDASGTHVYPDSGFVFKRIDASNDLTISVAGSVILGKINTPITAGFNLVSVPYPVDKGITLGTSNLYPANPANFDINKHLEPGGSAATADQVLIFDGGIFTTYYYKDIDNPFDPNDVTGWVSSTDNTQSKANVALPAGSFFILRKDSNPSFEWENDSVIAP